MKDFKDKILSGAEGTVAQSLDILVPQIQEQTVDDKRTNSQFVCTPLAPVIEYVAPNTDVTYTFPALVIKCRAPAPVVIP